MRKMTYLISSVLLIMTMLSGCVSVPTLTDDQSNKIANYSTALLLKYDANYKSRLVDTAAIEAERAIIAEEEQKKMEEEAAMQAQMQAITDAEETDSNVVVEEIMEDKYVDIDSTLGLEGVDLAYSYFEIVDKYPEEEITAVASVTESNDGNSLLVVHFTLTNLLETANEVSIYDTNANFSLIINKTNQKNVLTTLLLNDMVFFSGKLQPGEMKDLVLISGINETESSNIQNLSMNINVNNESVRTKLQ